MRVPLEWLKDFVDVRVKPERLSHLLTMAGLEVERIERVGTDTIFEIGLTPNRADCLSIMGVAREIAALTGAKLKLPVFKAPRGSGKMASAARIAVKHPRQCPRYTARVIEGVKISSSPGWIVKRLADFGVRSINNVVDATNYVMLETGQPLHAFDLRFLRGGRIVVQKAGKELSFGTLDGVERNLLEDDLLICDGEGPVALAGVMGGDNSEVRQSTTSVLLESAFFEPTSIRRTSRRLGATSESSRRFERGVDPNGTLAALHRLTQVILDTAGGTPTADWVDIYPKKVFPKRVALAETEVERILGMKVGVKKSAEILSRLCFAARSSRGKISVSVPTFRPDILRPIDLIEEIARVAGYDSIPESMPVARIAPLVRPRFLKEEELSREALVGAGLTEAVIYGFTSAESLEPFAGTTSGEVGITNPLSAEQGVMRTTLLPGLLDALKLNASRQCTDCRLFALARVYSRPMSIGPSEEPRHVAGVMAGRRFPSGWERSREPLDFYDAKGVVETLFDALGVGRLAIFQRGEAGSFLHPGSFAYVICGGKRIGFVGQLHPDVCARWEQEREIFVFELKFEQLAELATAEAPRFSELSRYPFVQRDLAVVVPDRIPAVEVEKVIFDAGVDIVSSVRIFDVYRGNGVAQGHKSLGLSLILARNDRTLTDEETEAAQEKVVDALKQKLGAVLRT
ncbi:MAG: phenylalanine--tRNA ligase subunit beta [Pseudomonadota bacterium]